MGEKDDASADYGTFERHQRDGGVVRRARTVTSGGGTTSDGAQVVFECGLDRLLGKDPAKGHLMGSQGAFTDRVLVARSRFNAGLRLRRVFLDAGLQQLHAQSYTAREGGDGEMSDRQALARRRFNHLMRRLGRWGQIAEAAACFDELRLDLPVWVSNVRTALDKLCAVLEEEGRSS